MKVILQHMFSPVFPKLRERMAETGSTGWICMDQKVPHSQATVPRRRRLVAATEVGLQPVARLQPQSTPLQAKQSDENRLHSSPPPSHVFFTQVAFFLSDRKHQARKPGDNISETKVVQPVTKRRRIQRAIPGDESDGDDDDDANYE
jgi:hypothetical protein